MPLPDRVVRFLFQGPHVEYVFVHTQSLLQPNDKNHIIFQLPGIPAGRFDFIFGIFYYSCLWDFYLHPNKINVNGICWSSHSILKKWKGNISLQMQCSGYSKSCAPSCLSGGRNVRDKTNSLWTDAKNVYTNKCWVSGRQNRTCCLLLTLVGVRRLSGYSRHGQLT